MCRLPAAPLTVILLTLVLPVGRNNLRDRRASSHSSAVECSIQAPAAQRPTYPLIPRCAVSLYASGTTIWTTLPHSSVSGLVRDDLKWGGPSGSLLALLHMVCGTVVEIFLFFFGLVSSYVLKKI